MDLPEYTGKPIVLKPTHKVENTTNITAFQAVCASIVAEHFGMMEYNQLSYELTGEVDVSSWRCKKAILESIATHISGKVGDIDEKTWFTRVNPIDHFIGLEKEGKDNYTITYQEVLKNGVVINLKLAINTSIHQLGNYTTSIMTQKIIALPYKVEKWMCYTK